MKKRKISITVTILFLLLLTTNFIWFKLYIKEHNKLKHATIPTLKDDYFTKVKVLTQYRIHSENNAFINTLGSVAELQVGGKLPYNIYFETEKDYQNFLKENSNIKDAPLILQNPDYPNGCESASAVMFLNSLGIDITLKEFVETYLEVDKVYENHGERYGPNPSNHYAGDPKSKNRGWGALQPVITNAITKVIEDKNASTLKNDNFLVTNDSQNVPLYLIASNNHSAIIWITQDYEESNEVYEWFSYDQKFTYTYPKKSHTVLLTGMDESFYYINDPLKEQPNIKIPHSKLEASFNSMGRQFITIT